MVCKLNLSTIHKKIFNIYSLVLLCLLDRFHPEEFYASPMRGLTPDDFAKMGISMSPLNTLSNMPLPDAQRLSCYLECDLKECPRGNEEICRASDCHRTLVDEGQGKTADTPFIMQNRDNPQPCSG